VLVPRTAEGSRVTVSALRSSDVGGGVTFHTFALPEVSCVRLLIKNLGTATNAPWYIGNKQIHDDLGVPYFPDHIRHLTESFDSSYLMWGTRLSHVSAGMGQPRVKQAP
jgi:hypothetical protein